MERGWDRLHDLARMLRELDGNNQPLVEGDNDDKDDKYYKDGDIPNNATGTPLA